MGVLDAPAVTRAQVQRTVDSMLAAGNFVIGHRGSGANIAPDGTLDAMIAAHAYGLDGIEQDTVRLADAGIGVMHDLTVDRTTTASGNCEDYGTAAWRNLTVDCSTWFHSSWPDTKAALFNDVLARLGGRTILFPEAKGSTVTIAQDAANLICDLVNNAGLTKSVVVQSFAWSACLNIRAKGIDAMFLDNDGTTHTPSELVANGIRFLGCDYTLISDATIAAFVAAGIYVVPFIVNYQSTADTLFAKGCKGIFSDDPLYAMRRYSKYRQTKAPWTVNGTYFHGHLAYSTRGSFVGSAGAYLMQPGTSGTFLFGAISPLANASGTYRLTVPYKLATAGADATQWGGVYFAATDDQQYSGDTNDGYLAMMRQNGTLQLYKRATGGGAFSSQKLTATAALTSGTTTTLQIDVTPTQVTLQRTDTAVATTSGSLTSGVAVTSIPINALAVALASGSQVMLPTGQVATLSGAAAAAATALPVTSITPSSTVNSGASLYGACQITDSAIRGGYVYLRDNGQNSGSRVGQYGAITVT